ncbi:MULTISPECIES: hypothetical protein [unclassified Lentimonas]|uniref:hypothetical protein n=1 Tax=unclassified Lentimonas TaxID=2630993 RepID=UPI00132262FB|nr:MULTISPECIES: hypothetical protein [unclassified Lentimonas]CAA6677364.1 Unannotated [Lentimonas sp. CC4]CAA6686909.1 Unannotated [Lentimonas sp. CC6]CAA6690092.1 Unannotated [Lentimonas sp. CC19]CAA6690949.1 Unannotated [Lentimonas sp. CC10]CAA7070702.1 Unannotated [Lentimonas sp. CC11]
MSTVLNISRHAFRRMHERVGLGRRAASRNAQRAWHLGQNIKRIKRPDRWVLANMPAETSECVDLRYGNFYYIFEKSVGEIVLVTVIPVKEESYA